MNITETGSIRIDHTINIGDTIVEHIAQDTSNKLESVPFNLSAYEKTNKLWLRSGGFKLRSKLAKKLSREGKAAIYYIDTKDVNTSILDLFTVVNTRRVGMMITKISISNDSSIMYEGESCPIWTEIELVQGKWESKTKFEWIEETEGDNLEIVHLQHGETITSDYKPFSFFSNNEEEIGDVDNAKVRNLLKEITYYSNKLGVSVEYGKNLYVNNENFSDKNAQEVMDNIEKGDSVIDESSFDSKLAGALQSISSGMGFSQALTALIDYCEDKILKYSGTIRDTINSGSNSHNLEIALANQFAFEYMMKKLIIRQQDYNDLFNTLNQITGESVVVTVELSQLESAKLRLLEADIAKALAGSVVSGEVKPVKTETKPQGGN